MTALGYTLLPDREPNLFDDLDRDPAPRWCNTCPKCETELEHGAQSCPACDRAASQIPSPIPMRDGAHCDVFAYDKAAAHAAANQFQVGLSREECYLRLGVYGRASKEQIDRMEGDGAKWDKVFRNWRLPVSTPVQALVAAALLRDLGFVFQGYIDAYLREIASLPSSHQP